MSVGSCTPNRWDYQFVRVRSQTGGLGQNEQQASYLIPDGEQVSCHVIMGCGIRAVTERRRYGTLIWDVKLFYRSFGSINSVLAHTCNYAAAVVNPRMCWILTSCDAQRGLVLCSCSTNQTGSSFVGVGTTDPADITLGKCCGIRS